MKYREIVRAIAFAHYGFVTTKDAIGAGVPAVELPKLAARGGLENVAYGVYRVSDIPPTPYDQFAEALLRVGEGAYLHGETVLALVGLAGISAPPIKIAVRRRARPTLPPTVALVRVRDEVRTTLYEGLKAQPVIDAILECQERVENERLMVAARHARSKGLLTTTDWQRVRSELRPTGALLRE